MVSCSGAQCHNGICTGSECTPEENQDECKAEEADSCTGFVGSSSVTSASTYTTTTSTRFQTITACSAEATTTDTTRNGPETITLTDVNSFCDIDSAVPQSVFNSLASRQSEETEWEVSTSTSISTTSTSTTGSAPIPSEVSYSCHGSSRRGTFIHLASFCDKSGSYLRGGTTYG